MAHLVSKTGDAVIPVLWSVDARVGLRYCANKIEDVFLVQTLLVWIGLNDRRPEHKPLATLKIDGVINFETHKCIAIVQTRMQEMGLIGWPDGVVSPCAGIRYSGSRMYTMAMLNGVSKRYMPFEWPRIDRISPARKPIADLVRRELVGANTMTL